MKSPASRASTTTRRLRLRLKTFATRLGSLILLFQRLPIVQYLLPEANFLGSVTLSNTTSLAVTTVVGLGAYDTVCGQSQISQRAPLVVLGLDPADIYPTAETAINVPATVSAPLTFSFNWDPLNQFSVVKSWRCTTGGVVGTLPAGLGPALQPNPTVAVGGLITISGTPTAAPGIYPVKVSVYRNASYMNSEAAQIFNICVLGFSTQPAASTTINSGGTTTLTCVAAGNPVAIPKVAIVDPNVTNFTPNAQPGGTLTYEWYEGTSGTLGTVLGTSSSFTTPALTSSKNYWVRIKSVLGTSTVYANSNTAAVTVSTPTTVSVGVSPASVLENSGSAMVYTFTRSSTTGSLTANYSASGTATAGSDYPTPSGTVTFADGAATATVSITPTGDSTVESDETVILTVTTGTGYSVGSPSSATGTITNDDTPFSSWASGLPQGQSGATSTPQGDGVPNLAKFAFNMDPLAPDVRHLSVGGNETAGLPAGSKSGAGGVLRIEFLRRKSSTSPGITYTTQFSSTIGTWDDFVGSPVSVSSIDSTWERVVVDDPTGGGTRFARVKVSQP